MVLTFGEILLRLSPALGGQWIKDSTIPTFIGGAELNVATALANWGIDVATGKLVALDPVYGNDHANSTCHWNAEYY